MHLRVLAGFLANAALILLAAAACFLSIASGTDSGIGPEFVTAFCYLLCGIVSLAVFWGLSQGGRRQTVAKRKTRPYLP